MTSGRDDAFHQQLRWAIATGDPDAAEKLVARRRVDPLAEAYLVDGCHQGSLPVVEQLCRFTCLRQADYDRALVAAAERGHWDVVRFLIHDRQADPGACVAIGDGWSGEDNAAIRLAALNGHDRVVAILLQSERCNPGASQSQALRNAASAGHVRIVERLIVEKSVDASALHGDCLTQAARNGHIDIVRVLLQRTTADPCAWRCAPLRAACSRANADRRVALPLAELLLEHMDPGRFDVDDLPLSEAASCHDDRVLTTLLRVPGCNPAANHNAAIIAAAEAGDVVAVSVLLGFGSVRRAPRLPDAFRAACANGHHRALRLLVGHVDDASGLIRSAITDTLQMGHAGATRELCWHWHRITGECRPPRQAAVRAVVVAERLLDRLPRDLWNQVLFLAHGRRFYGANVRDAIDDMTRIRLRLAAPGARRNG
ncbi:hypothetical protein PBRA_001524 [Plasmodiophora brassicae]|uniref:Uncharacterized protein n=1 Tax=Plasmodiophora brassicae TaxID=37360 RepID=A0A0G4IYQ7_PLABS|nr:hypothetical protein PBRA_001524 [Plasmodiophora brassicae]